MKADIVDWLALIVVSIGALIAEALAQGMQNAGKITETPDDS